MTVRNGREFLSIPGPTTVPDEVLNAMHRPAIEIYSGALVDITETCLADLGRIFRTDGSTYIYAANGHGAWEAALVNVLSRGDKVLILASGRFAVGWGEMAGMLELEVDTLPGDWRHAVDPAALEARLREDAAGEIKAVLVVQVDTASGVVNDIPAIRKAMDAAGHGALLMVDTIASLGTMPFEMDGWGVDVSVTGSQKGLMTPPGLGFVAAGKRAAARIRTPGFAPAIGIGRSGMATSIIRNTAVRRRNTCCSAFARRWICCSKKGSRTSSNGIDCWRRRCGAPSPCGPRAAKWSSIFSSLRTVPIRSRRSGCARGSIPG